MGIFRSVAGLLEVELTSADPEGTIRAINASGVLILHMAQEGDFSLTFTVRKKDYRKITNIAEKRGETLKIKRRLGLYWRGKRSLKRPILLLGMVILLTLAMHLPSRIYFVRVEGNESIPTNLILQQAEECGIKFGASRRTVRSEKMKNALLAAIPELRWAGVNTKGCVAVISVREKVDAKSDRETPAVSGIFAVRDGVITQSTVESGNPLCRVGQAVREGELLVSGYTNCEFSIRATRSVGEIFGLTNRSVHAVTPAEMTVRREKTEHKKKYAILIGKKRINFYKDSGISGASCDKMIEVNYLSLPGGFTLPVALVTEHLQFYEQKQAEQPLEKAQMLLEEFAEGYLKQQMIAGQILKKALKTDCADGVFQLIGDYACSEMIGREQPVEIIK